MKKTTLTLFLSIFLALNAFTQSTATYDITFTSTWNATDHGTLPSNAHWSDLVGANHNSNITFLEIGAMASPGIKDVAELGSNGVFNSEVQSEINSGNAQQWFQESVNPFAAIASATLSNVVISEDFPLLTLASMIAPSPDWMIAVNSLNLWDTSTNRWKESFSIDLYPYDAGTEEGYGYSINNLPTSPQGVITNVAGATGYPFNNEKIGTLTVTFKSTTLSIEDINSFENVNLFPNPNVSGILSISNASKIDRISVFDVLGKKVKQLKLKETSQNIQTIDISELNKGVYIIKLYGYEGESISKKLIVN